MPKTPRAHRNRTKRPHLKDLDASLGGSGCPWHDRAQYEEDIIAPQLADLNRIARGGI